MLKTNYYEIPQLLSHSFISTEAALFKYIHAVFLLNLALKKRAIKLQFRLDQHEPNLFSLLTTLSEIEKLLLKHLNFYHRYLETSELAELKKGIKQYSRDLTDQKKICYYTTSIMKLCYGKNYTQQIDFQAKNLMNDFNNYFDLKRNLIK